jgi:predicted CopG family antitoxin
VSSSIRLRKETIEELKSLGKKGDSYDEIVIWLLNNRKRRKRA